jgi:type IV protein arginine methyltransferase
MMTAESSDSSSAADPDIEAASLIGEQLISSILADQPIVVIKNLIDNSAPLWYQTDEGISCLHAAAYCQNTELVKYLIEKGAVWNAGVS